MLKESKRVKLYSQRSKLNKNSASRFNKLISNSNISIINDVMDTDDIGIDQTLERPIKIGDNVKNRHLETVNIYTRFATFFKNPNEIMIPTKVKTLIERKLPKHYLDKIHGGAKTKENREVAIELCLLLLSQLSSTHRNILNGESPEGWKSLRAEYLRQLLRINDKTYQYVKKALLEFKYDLGPILEERFYAKGKHSYGYRLGESFRSKGFVPYELKTKHVQGLLKRSYERKIKITEKNTICVNLVEFYKTITLPTIEEIENEARKLIKLGYHTKKGKRLIFRNKKGDEYFSNIKKLSFVEDALKIFNYLTRNGLLIPRPGNERSGCRVVDSFTLMPSWIRKLVKVNGVPMTESDYSCLHPNIAMSLYGGNIKYLKHEDLALELQIETKIVKIEHLSFFNKKVHQMKMSPLFKYYKHHESDMLNTIIAEKNGSEFENKITSRRLFATEVEIMKKVISRLNEEGIFVGYVYDALFFDPVHAEKVKELMDEVAIELGVFTVAKL